jgi:hypothetical protein
LLAPAQRATANGYHLPPERYCTLRLQEIIKDVFHRGERVKCRRTESLHKEIAIFEEREGESLQIDKT